MILQKKWPDKKKSCYQFVITSFQKSTFRTHIRFKLSQKQPSLKYKLHNIKGMSPNFKEMPTYEKASKMYNNVQIIFVHNFHVEQDL